MILDDLNSNIFQLPPSTQVTTEYKNLEDCTQHAKSNFKPTKRTFKRVPSAQENGPALKKVLKECMCHSRGFESGADSRLGLRQFSRSSIGDLHRGYEGQRCLCQCAYWSWEIVSQTHCLKGIFDEVGYASKYQPSPSTMVSRLSSFPSLVSSTTHSPVSELTPSTDARPGLGTSSERNRSSIVVQHDPSCGCR